MNSLALTGNISTQSRLPLRVTVYKVLAGDLIHVQTPNEESLLIDCGFHRGNAILEAVLGQERRLDFIVVTHQHLDHFATLANFVSSPEIRPRIYHSGVSYPPGYTPSVTLSTCPHYAGLEAPLWQQYSTYIRGTDRWSLIDGLSDVRVSNLLPSEHFQVDSDGEYHSLNRSATPVLIEYAGHRIVIGSDAEADQLVSAIERNGSAVALYIASSHGRPTHNDASVLQALNPAFICLTDSFEGSDFTKHYRKAVPGADVRSVNIDGSQCYSFWNDGRVQRNSVEVCG